eukprot:15465455-Alexandrium_andersonii.AAC.1
MPEIHQPGGCGPRAPERAKSPPPRPEDRRSRPPKSRGWCRRRRASRGTCAMGGIPGGATGTAALGQQRFRPL